MKKQILDWLARIMVLGAAIEAVILLIYNPIQLLVIIIATMIVLAFRWAFIRVLPKDEEEENKPVKARAIRTMGGICAVLAVALAILTPVKAQQSNYSQGGYSVSVYNGTPTYVYNQGTSFGMNYNANYDYSYQSWGQTVMSVLKDPINWAYSLGNISKMFDGSGGDPSQSIWASGVRKSGAGLKNP